MKQILKRVSSVCTALICAASLTVAGSAVVFADSEANETIQNQTVMIAEGLTSTITPLTDEDIENYMNSGDEFTEQAMDAWVSAKDELGEFEETEESEVEFSDNQYVVTVPAKFEKADAEFVYIFDEQGNPTSMSVNVQYPLSVNLERAALNTVMGLGTVFIMLVFLSFVIYLFKFVPALVEGKKKEAPEAPVAAPVVPTVPAVETQTDDTELVAVISAAIAAAEGTSTDGFVVRSIRKVNRKKR